MNPIVVRCGEYGYVDLCCVLVAVGLSGLLLGVSSGDDGRTLHFWIDDNSHDMI
jgi:hypothetical protein